MAVKQAWHFLHEYMAACGAEYRRWGKGLQELQVTEDTRLVSCKKCKKTKAFKAAMEAT